MEQQLEVNQQLNARKQLFREQGLDAGSDFGSKQGLTLTINWWWRLRKKKERGQTFLLIIFNNGRRSDFTLFFFYLLFRSVASVKSDADADF